ncbi:AGC/PKA protein kinase, partial [Anncaliia algerae PRA109]
MFFTRDLIFCRTVGEGSFGRVVKVSAKHSIDNLKYFALKLIKKDSINSQDYVNSLMNEIKIFGEVNGEPFFPRLYDTFYAADRFCFLTDFCEGGELLSLIHKTNGFSLQQIKFYGAEILLALGSLHDKNIIYRDLKSENVLLTRDGHIKLVDFGLSIKTTSLVNDRV